MNERDDLEQLKLITEYIKFHIGLYLATPAALVIVAQGMKVDGSPFWIAALIFMILAYLISGISAGWFMGKYINTKWTPELIEEFSKAAYSDRRRFLHHTMYWIGLGFGVLGLIVASIQKLWLTCR
jgi:hypothetical protein